MSFLGSDVMETFYKYGKTYSTCKIQYQEPTKVIPIINNDFLETLIMLFYIIMADCYIYIIYRNTLSKTTEAFKTCILMLNYIKTNGKPPHMSSIVYILSQSKRKMHLQRNNITFPQKAIQAAAQGNSSMAAVKGLKQLQLLQKVSFISFPLPQRNIAVCFHQSYIPNIISLWNYHCVFLRVWYKSYYFYILLIFTYPNHNTKFQNHFFKQLTKK